VPVDIIYPIVGPPINEDDTQHKGEQTVQLRVGEGCESRENTYGHQESILVLKDAARPDSELYGGNKKGHS
jgi:hypothetical protein